MCGHCMWKKSGQDAIGTLLRMLAVGWWGDVLRFPERLDVEQSISCKD